MNSKVNTYISHAITNGSLSGADLAALAALYNSSGGGSGLSSIQSLDGLPGTAQTTVRDAFRDAVRWAFVALVPWAGVATVSSLFLSRIGGEGVDTDAETREGADAGRSGTAGIGEDVERLQDKP